MKKEDVVDLNYSPEFLKTQSAPLGDMREEWEYLEEFDCSPERLMKLGKDGWELVEVLRSKYNPAKQLGKLFERDQDKYIFKRPRQ